MYFGDSPFQKDRPTQTLDGVVDRRIASSATSTTTSSSSSGSRTASTTSQAAPRGSSSASRRRGRDVFLAVRPSIGGLSRGRGDRRSGTGRALSSTVEDNDGPLVWELSLLGRLPVVRAVPADVGGCEPARPCPTTWSPTPRVSSRVELRLRPGRAHEPRGRRRAGRLERVRPRVPDAVVRQPVRRPTRRRSTRAATPSSTTGTPTGTGRSTRCRRRSSTVDPCSAERTDRTAATRTSGSTSSGATAAGPTNAHV